MASKPLLPYEPSGSAERKIDWTGEDGELRERFNCLPDRIKAACEQRGQKPDSLRHLFGIADGNKRTLLEKVGLARGMLFDFERDMQTNGALEDLNECFLIVVVVLIREIIAPLAERLEKHSSVRMLRWAEDPTFEGMAGIYEDVSRIEALSKRTPVVQEPTPSTIKPDPVAVAVSMKVDDLASTPQPPVSSKPTHSTDFTFANWFGTEYTFALGLQSSAVKALWDEWESSGLGLHQNTIRNAVDPERDNFRMDSAFRKHPAFGTMIQRCGDGKFKLNPSSSDEATPTPKLKKNAGISSKPRQKRV